MEKSQYREVPADAAGMSSSTAPPSYEQATGSTVNYGFSVTQQPVGTGFQNAAPPPPQPQPQPQPYTMPHPQPQTQPTYYQQPPMQHSVVIVQQQTLLPLGPEPTYVTCPNCHIQKLTRIEYEPSAKTHLMAAILCLLGFWCCACMPYCAGSCMNANHYCGNCNHYLGAYGSAL